MPDGVLLASPVQAEILAGLNASQKTLPAKLFYDEEGCRLFHLITDLDEYYLTRTELLLLGSSAGEIAAAAPADTLVEYGASDETKADFLLDQGHYETYVPIDIAASALDALAARLAASRPSLTVSPLVADFTKPLRLPVDAATGALCGFFPGSTIGNFEPDLVVTFLENAAQTLSSGDGAARLVVGTDLRKDPDRVLPAYDDDAGVTAAFNKNILAHVNRIAMAEFDLDQFAHRAVWNDAQSRIEMHLVSNGRQAVRVAGHLVQFEDGETIHTESSYKHTRAGFDAFALQAGWRPANFWTDPDGLFGIHLLEMAG